MKQSLIVSYIFDGTAKPLQALLDVISEHQGIIIASHLLTLGDKQSLQLHVNGAWNDIAKLETALIKLAKEWHSKILLDRANKVANTKKVTIYSVDLNIPDNNQTVQEICQFFLENEVLIYEMHVGAYFTNPLGQIMTNLRLYILIPDNFSIPELRENFVNLCDSLNLDAYLEPIHG